MRSYLLPRRSAERNYRLRRVAVLSPTASLALGIEAVLRLQGPERS